MTSASIGQPRRAASATQSELCRRASALGLTGWAFDNDGVQTAGPDTPPAVRAAVTGCARPPRPPESGDDAGPADDELHLIRDKDGTVAFQLSGAAGGLARSRLVETLNLFHADLTRAADDRCMINGFDVGLSQAYEEVNLIFSMARSLATPGDPAAVVRQITDSLCESLGFGWLVIAFADDARVVESLQDAIAVSGQSAPSAAAIRAELRRVGPETAVVRSPGAGDDFTSLAAVEVLTQRVGGDQSALAALFAGTLGSGVSDLSSNQIQMTEAAASLLTLFHENTFRFAQQKKQFLGTLRALTATVDAKDSYTRGHSERVGMIASRLATAIGMNPAAVEDVRVAGLLHDIGKIGVSETVLCKASRLTEDEFEQIKKHPVVGFNILKDLPSLESQLPGVLHHHERWDGRGYPAGLAGNAIPAGGSDPGPSRTRSTP